MTDARSSTKTKSPSVKDALLGRLRFRGAASVGERGQMALPAELRRELDVKSGEKLLVFRVDGHEAALVLTADGIASLLEGAAADELRQVFSDLVANGNGHGKGGKPK